jgi:double-GTPase-like protein
VRNSSQFISRFWLALDAEGSILAKAGLPSDLEYLASGADHLLRGEFAERTPPEVRDATEIPVRNTSKGDEFLGTLVVPDLPG